MRLGLSTREKKSIFDVISPCIFEDLAVAIFGLIDGIIQEIYLINVDAFSEFLDELMMLITSRVEINVIKFLDDFFMKFVGRGRRRVKDRTPYEPKKHLGHFNGDG